jgi:DNA-3-methyladenine glycosylase
VRIRPDVANARATETRDDQRGEREPNRRARRGRGRLEAERIDAADRLIAAAARPPRRLARAELPADTVELARYLIGKTLIHDGPDGHISGRIVETEAYVVGDAAGHAFRGPTARNRSLYLKRGHAYVYFIYGMYYLLNVSSEQAGVGAGVLLRALEPVEGVESMRRRRASAGMVDLARGPGRLTAAMGIDRRHDGLDLCGPGPLRLALPARSAGRCGSASRRRCIGCCASMSAATVS